MRLASTVLMVRPASFGFNAEAAETNRFARAGMEAPAERARAEFDAAVVRLREAGIRVCVAEDTASPPKPDAVFPNNWVSFGPDGGTVLFPMAPVSRRAERRNEIVALVRGAGWRDHCVDLTGLEASGGFVEGTGSLVLDHAGATGFAARSPRTTEAGISAFERATGYRITCFEAWYGGAPVYHSNVVLALGPGVAVVALALVEEGREALVEALRAGGRDLVEIDAEQVAAYAGNLLWLEGAEGPVVAMSRSAEAAFTAAQRARLGRRVVLDIPTIEAAGGGSARCMLAEVFERE